MSEEQRRQVLIGVLVVGLIGAGVYFYMNVLAPPPIQPTQAAQPGAAAPGAAAATPGVAIDDIDINELISAVGNVNFDYRADRLARNPMTPLVLQRGGTQVDEGVQQIPIMQRARSMLLTAILYSPEKPLAVINNAVVEEGHVFLKEEDGGITVQKIEPSRVTLSVQEERVVLDMEEQ